jgi:hypothetical protein
MSEGKIIIYFNDDNDDDDVMVESSKKCVAFQQRHTCVHSFRVMTIILNSKIRKLELSMMVPACCDSPVLFVMILWMKYKLSLFAKIFSKMQ